MRNDIRRIIGGVVMVAMLAGAGQSANRPTAVAERLKADAGNLIFRLVYVGPEDKPFYTEAWGRKVSMGEMMPGTRGVITPDQARAVVAWMAREGLVRSDADAGPGPRYQLQVYGGRDACTVDLGWGLPMLKYVEGMRGALGLGGGERMERLLARLEEHRKEWEKEAARAASEKGEDTAGQASHATKKT